MRRYFCCDEYRRRAVDDHATLNGIDFLEVLGGPDVPEDVRQRELYVHFLKPLPTSGESALTKDSIRITGGERIEHIPVDDATPGTGDQAHVLTVRVEYPGDFSTYTLRLVHSDAGDDPPPGYDPLLAAVDFSFKAECDTDFDCDQEDDCPPDDVQEPDNDYLAKDYASFRQLMLDRMATIMPGWQERNPADLGVALVEALAYVGDHLSYYQDAIATEAYLGTARRRISVRRHARLVDYVMYDGCNARVWVQIRVKEGSPVGVDKGTKLLTRVPDVDPSILDGGTAFNRALTKRPEVFGTMYAVTLFGEHNEMPFYTWGDERCCLPRRAIRATLRGHYPNLKAGDVLIFEERRGPRTGDEADADKTHRHTVRLVTAPQLTEDPLFIDPETDVPVQVTNIEWAREDELPFPVCISVCVGEGDTTAYYDDVSIALGNVVLADHGLTLPPEKLPDVPEPELVRAAASGTRCDEEKPPEAVPPRYLPPLKRAPLTQAAPLNLAAGSAYAMMSWSVHEALPAIWLHSRPIDHPDAAPELWKPVIDLLASGPDQAEFAVEIENDGAAYLRFGEPPFGRRPTAEEQFEATYRVGNGTRGNIGSDALYHIATETLDDAITGIRNPLPARGGLEMESIEEARRNAPEAFRNPIKRAVTPADYETLVNRHNEVQRCAARFRWTGSWYTVFITVDRLGGLPITPEFEARLRWYIEEFRMAGHDIEVDGPVYVPLEIGMEVCVNPDYFRDAVRDALLEVFNNRVLPDGRRGIFHPDNFTFGQTVYLSPLYAAAVAVEGVESVTIDPFQVQEDPSRSGVEDGKIVLERLQIARLDNDPNYPKRGVFRLTMRGGK